MHYLNQLLKYNRKAFFQFLKATLKHFIYIRESKQCYLLAQIEGKDRRKYFLNIDEVVLLPGLYQPLILGKVNDFHSFQSGMSYQFISYVMRPLNLIENFQKKAGLYLNNTQNSILSYQPLSLLQ